MGTCLNLWVFVIALLKLKAFSNNTAFIAEPQHVVVPAAIDVCKFSVPLQVAANLGIQVPPLLAQIIGFFGGLYVKTAYKVGKYGHCDEFKAEVAEKTKPPPASAGQKRTR